MKGFGTFSWKRETYAVGSVQIAGDSVRKIRLDQGVTLFGSGEASKCVVASEPLLLSYLWTVRAPSLSEQAQQELSAAFDSSIPKNQIDLSIAPFSLDFVIGTEYMFALHLNQTYKGVSSVSVAEVIVVVEGAPPVARITGGSRTVSASEDLEVAGTDSYDPYVPRQEWSSDGLVMCWQCTVGQAGDDCPFTLTPAPTVVVPAASIAYNAKYHVTLTVARRVDLAAYPVNMVDDCDKLLYSRDNGNTVPSSAVSVVLTTPAVQGSPPVSMITPMAKSKYNPHEKFTLGGFVHSADVNATSTNLHYTWSIEPRPENWATSLVSAGASLGRGSISLCVKSGAVLEGQTYRVFLTVEEGDMRSVSHMDVFVNSPPVQGKFQVSPVEGDALVTDFSLEASGWQDEDLPVTIVFGFMDHSQTTPLRVPLGAPSEKIDMTTKLPVGDRTDNFNLQVFCEVSDGLGAVRRASCLAATGTPDCLVRVKQWDRSMDDLRDLVSASMAQNEALGDAKRILAYAALLSLTMKKGVEAPSRRSAALPDFSPELIQSAYTAISKSQISDDFRAQSAASLQAMMPSADTMQQDYAETSLKTYKLLLNSSFTAISTEPEGGSIADAFATGLAVIAKGVSRMGRTASGASARRVGVSQQLSEAQKEHQALQEELFGLLYALATASMREHGTLYPTPGTLKYTMASC